MNQVSDNLSVANSTSKNEIRNETKGKPEIITINVGGHLHTTTNDTMCKGESMLSKMFSESWRNSNIGERDGYPFIDRDGTNFRYILNYLRSGKFVPPSDPAQLQEILVEADYYQIKELSAHIEKLLEREKKVQFCKVLCTGDWIGQLNYLVEKGWEIHKFMLETESKYRELDDYGKPLKDGVGWYDIQTQCILLRRPLSYQ